MVKKKQELHYYNEDGQKVIVKKDRRVERILIGCIIPLLLIPVLIILFGACAILL